MRRREGTEHFKFSSWLEWSFFLKFIDAAFGFGLAVLVLGSLAGQHFGILKEQYTCEEAKLLILTGVTALFRLELSSTSVQLLTGDPKPQSAAITLFLTFAFSLLHWEDPLQLQTPHPLCRFAQIFLAFLFRSNLLALLLFAVQRLLRGRENVQFFGELLDRGLTVGQFAKLQRRVWMLSRAAPRDYSLQSSLHGHDVEWTALSEKCGTADGQPLLSHDSVEDEVELCLVCAGSFGQGDTLAVTPVCGHRAHTACFRIWFETSPACPDCRFNVKRHLQLNSPF